MTENSSAGSRRLRVETDRVITRPGQKLTLTARAYDSQLAETQAYQLSATFGPDEEASTSAQITPLTPVAGTMLYRSEISIPSWHELDREGSQRGLLSRDLHVVAREGDDIVAESRVTVWILDDSDEYLELRPQPQTLQVIADGTGGDVITTGKELAERLRGLPSKKGDVIVTRTPTWDRPLFLTFVVVLLGVEWILRRRAGYG